MGWPGSWDVIEMGDVVVTRDEPSVLKTVRWNMATMDERVAATIRDMQGESGDFALTWFLYRNGRWGPAKERLYPADQVVLANIYSEHSTLPQWTECPADLDFRALKLLDAIEALPTRSGIPFEHVVPLHPIFVSPEPALQTMIEDGLPKHRWTVLHSRREAKGVVAFEDLYDAVHFRMLY